MKNLYNYINIEELGGFWLNAVMRDCQTTPDKLPDGVKIAGANITARVKSADGRVCSVQISVKSLETTTKEKLKEIFFAHPTTAFNVSIGHIEEYLINLLAKENPDIFPQSQDDFIIRCSCGNPQSCRHVAVVLNALKKKINKNPLLIFTLRGMSLDELVEVTGFKNSHINRLRRKTGEKFIQNLEHKNVSGFSFPKADINSMFYALPNNPIFFERKDFKSKLKTIYETIDSELDSILINERLVPLRNTEFYLYNSGSGKLKAFVTPENTFLAHIKSKNSRLRYVSKAMEIPDVGEKYGIALDSDMVLDYFLYDAVNDNDDEITPSAQFIRETAHLALEVVKSLNFIPEVIMVNDTDFSIRYVPNAQYSGEYPELLPIFITHIIHKIAFLKTSKFSDDNVTALFTSPNTHSAITSEGKNIALSIAIWLDILSRQGQTENVVFRIEHNKNADNFSLYLDIPDYKNPDIINRLITATDYLPVLKEIMDSNGKYVPIVDLKIVLEIISYASSFLMALGIQVVIPKELNKIISPRLTLKARLKNSRGFNISDIFDKNAESKLSISSLFDFSYEVALGDEKISKEEFQELVRTAEGIVRFKEHYVLLKPEDINAILDKLNKPPVEAIDSMQFLQSTFSGFYNGMDFEIDETFKKAVDDYLKIDEITVPKTLNGTLRPYQERGFKWLYANTMRGFGSCLADDMGLGKTVQVLSLLLKIKEEGSLTKPALVVCPTTLVGNWHKECSKFAPSLKVFIYHGTHRTLELKGNDVIITTYGLLRRDLDEFKDKDWDFVIVDEAQNIKNPDAGQTIAVKSLKAKISIAMTGTPVENRLTELWSIFDYINKGYLGNLRGFQQNYANIIEKHRDEERIQKLKLATAPFTMRRLKSDKSIISDLPEKIIFDEYCYLTKEQAALYEKVLENSFKEMQGKTGIHRKGHIFKLITALKQICNHPVHYTKTGSLNKDLSGKTEKTFSIIEQILEQNEKTILFTQYKEMGEILVKLLRDGFKMEAPFFHGSLLMKERDEMVEAFQANDDIKLMIISLKAGGTGLNLTAATNVIHYDLWWNPAVEDQATDRTHRIGQTHNVIVYRLITLGTFEERIDEMIKSKKQLAELTVSTGENWITELSDKELREIFALSQ